MRTTRLIRAAVPLILLVGLGACGSDEDTPQSPTAAATPAPRAWTAGTTVRIVSGEGYRPVAGARVVLGGREYVTDGAGQIVLGVDASYGSIADVTASGFLNRRTVVPAGGDASFVLWPRDTANGMNAKFTSEIVYTYGWSNEPAHGTSPLERLPEGVDQVFVWISDEIRQDPTAARAHDDAVAEMNSALRGRATYALAATRPSGVVFEVLVAHGRSETCNSKRVSGYFHAYANSRGEITGGKIVYCGIESARSLRTVTHELGHSVGLQHVYSTQELMTQYFRMPWHLRTVSLTFSPREALAMRMLFERPAGNRFPDSDREVGASAGGVRTIVCH